MRSEIVLAALAALSLEASAQPSPFDMSSEGTPPASEQDASDDVGPSAESPSEAPAPSAAPASPAQPGGAPASDGAPPPRPAAPTAIGQRQIVPAASISLSGEVAHRRWAIFLTEAQAANAESVQIAYQSSILVAPEASSLRFIVNGQTVIDAPVASPEAVSEIAVAVPPNVLQAGLNTIAFEASMRHRTDCTVQSTYDLWTEIDGARSFVTFGDGAETRPRALEDVRAVGFDAEGLTRFNIAIAPETSVQASQSITRLSQGLALLGATPNQVVTVTEGGPAPTEAGSLSVLVGPAGALEALLPSFPGQARLGAYADFVEGADGEPVLLLSGPDWSSVEAAIDRLVAPVDRPSSVRRTSIANPGWTSPSAPLFYSGGSLPLRDLGVATEEFSGRRYRTEFDVAVPADFYAEAYGRATLLLDLAYTAAVRPGSTLDIYVNDNIATTIPIGSRTGEVLRSFPASVSLQNLRPGSNTIAIEAIIDAEADLACLPGTSTGGETRFVLFDSSTFQMQDFARISSRPDLSALSGNGFPFNTAEASSPLLLGDYSTETMSAAATLAARIASTAGRIVPFDTNLPASAATERDALFIGAAARLPVGVLQVANVSETLRSSWSGTEIAPAADAPSRISIDDWSQRVSSPVERVTTSIQSWLEGRFDLSLDALQLIQRRPEPFEAPAESSLIVAQGLSTDGEHSWTVVTAPSAEQLFEGVSDLARQANWNELSGRLTYYDEAQTAYASLPATGATLVPSVEPSFGNLRLVAANWLSERPLGYALLLALVSVVLGAATATMTSILGRRS